MNFNNIYNTYIGEYKTIFENFTFDKERFTEENQTVNFCHAIQKSYPNAVVWYEYPWINNFKKACRYDAVVYIPDENALLIIEAKCLRGTLSKYEAINSDLIRIITQNNQQIKLKGTLKIDVVYAVILADYWKKGKTAQWYTNIDEVWADRSIPIKKEKSGKPFKNFLNVATGLNDAEWYYDNSIYKNYYLFAMIGKL